jgi:hypothetical protein
VIEWHCKINNIDPNSSEGKAAKKAEMILSIAMTAVVMIGAIIMGVIAGAATGGAAIALLVLIIGVTILSAVVTILQASLEIYQASKQLKLSRKKLLTKVLTYMLEKMRMDIKLIKEDIDILIELFSSAASNARMEYERASSMLKEYNDTITGIAANTRA